MSLTNYPHWGLAETGNAGKITTVKPLDHESCQLLLSVLNSQVDLTGFELKKSGLVEHYQGKAIASTQLALVRLERTNSHNAAWGGEHISANLNLATKQLIGFTRMMKHLTGDTFVTHQEALNQAIIFLKQVAPDLVSNDVETPLLPQQDLGSKMEFKPALKLGNVELRWINDHKEEILVAGNKVDIHGMKVKLHLPATKLWAWVIIDKTGKVATFERNIFWNFNKYQRETQMWLHDKWLEAHNITLPSFS